MMKFQSVFWTTLALLLSSSAYSNFDLFDPDRGKPPPAPPAPPPKPFIAQTKPKLPSNTLPPLPFIQSRKQSPPRRLLPPKKLPPQKDFELRGTSIIGSFRAAILKGPDGKEFVQSLDEQQQTPADHFGVKIKDSEKIAGYDYYLLKVNQREIEIEYPEESPCRDSNDEKGLKCAEDQKTAMLTLKSLKALPSRKPHRPKVTKPPQATTTTANKRQTERDKRKQLYRNFKRRVIKDEEVPPGMRVVRTPFGDRLVPDNKKR